MSKRGQDASNSFLTLEISLETLGYPDSLVEKAKWLVQGVFEESGDLVDANRFGAFAKKERGVGEGYEKVSTVQKEN